MLYIYTCKFCRSRVLHHVHSFVPEHPINYIPSFGNSNKVVFLKAAKPQMFNKSKHLNLARHTKGFTTKALYGLIMHRQSYSPGWPPNRSFRFGLFLFGEMPRLQLGVFRHFRSPRDSTWPRCLSFLKFCLALVNIPVTWNLPLPLGLCYHWIHHCVTNTYALGCSTPLEVCISFAL